MAAALDRILEQIHTLTPPSDLSSIAERRGRNSTASRPSRYSTSSRTSIASRPSLYSTSSRTSTPTRRSSSNSSRNSISSIIGSTHDTYGIYTRGSSPVRPTRVSDQNAKYNARQRNLFDQIETLDSITNNPSVHFPDANTAAERLPGILEKRTKLFNTLGANNYATLAERKPRRMNGYI